MMNFIVSLFIVSTSFFFWGCADKSSDTPASGDTTAPVPSSATLSVSFNGTWSHLEVTVPYATDEVTSRDGLVYEVRVTPSSGIDTSSATLAVSNAGVIKEFTMGASDDSKTVQLSIASSSMYGVLVTVRDAAGNRAVYGTVNNTSVSSWQSSLSAASNADAIDDTYTGGDEPGARLGHELVYFSNNFYLIGGTNQVGTFPTTQVTYRSSANDIWTAPALTLPSSDTEYLKRAFFGATTHTYSSTEKIYIGGGEGWTVSRHTDILSSSNGSTWTVVTANAPFLPRVDFQFVSHDDSLYAIGGDAYVSGSYVSKNDVWKSTNGGVNWTQVSVSAPFTARKDFSAFSMRDCMYVIGGRSGSTHYQDVWRSCDDGVNWTQIKSPGPFAARRVKAAKVTKGLYVAGVIENKIEMMCAFGGNTASTYVGGLYCSYDGSVWFTYKSSVGIQRDDVRLVGGNGTLFVFGGTDSNFSGSPTGYPDFGSLLSPF